MPANTADVKLYTADYNGKSFGMEQPAGSDVRATIDANTNTVSVTGFDFNKYYVADKQHEGTYGKKLIIEFSVQRTEILPAFTRRRVFLLACLMFQRSMSPSLHRNWPGKTAMFIIWARSRRLSRCAHRMTPQGVISPL